MIKEKDDFLKWLENAKFVLPPKMTLEEAKQIWQRKIDEEEAMKDFSIKTISDFSATKQGGQYR